jgi:type IV pilus assembly protein PilZ
MAEDQDSANAEEAKKSNILSIAIADKNILHSTYMPFLTNGGLFIPTRKIFKMNQTVQIMLKLPEIDEKVLIDGEVVWITPEGAQNNKLPGIGIEFTGEDSVKIRKKIENLLGDLLTSVAVNHTM